MTPEKIVQNSIINYLTKLEKEGYPLYHECRQAGGFSYKMGIADLYAVYRGQHIEIEVKRPGGHQSPMQEKWEMRCKQLGIVYVCADSVEAVKAMFIKHWGNIDTF